MRWPGTTSHSTRGPAGRRWRGQRGQSLVELALIAPVFLLLTLGAIDYGRVYFSYVSVTNAARNGADYASQSPANASDLPGITAAALGDTQELSGSDPTVSATTGTDSRGNMYAEVTVVYEFDTLFPWPLLPTTLDVTRTVRTAVAQ